MNRQAGADALERELESLVAGRKRKAHPEWQPLVEIAADLRQLADPEFKSRLKSELFEETGRCEPERTVLDEITGATQFAEVLPALGGNPPIFPADQRSFLVSFLSHTALIALIASGIWGGRAVMMTETARNSSLTYVAAGNGGGGSGDRDPVPATRGTPPKLTKRQLAPPTIVVHRQTPSLPAPATVVGPPDIKFPPSGAIGELVSSNVVIPSNGSGLGGGAGNGSGTGLGAGAGIGVGPGSGRGFGGRGFHLTGRVLAPRAIYDPEPEYSEEARKVKLQGTVLLSMVVDEQGRAKDIRVARSLGMGLDEKAVEAVKKWKFAPGTRDGTPVSTEVSVEVSFRLY
ncbi:MAG: energy transducer TonB [Acidobacteria bacterium]|nr:energy transducer TonB [Acidobacteriota bacterium]